MNPAVYWMDVSDKASYCIEKEENKGSQTEHIKLYKIKVISNESYTKLKDYETTKHCASILPL